MSSMVRRIEKGRGGFIGLLDSARSRWGAKLGVRNPDHPPAPFPGAYLQGRVAKGSRRGKRNKAYIERRKALADA